MSHLRSALEQIVQSHLIDALAEIQRQSEREVPAMTPDTIPLDHLAGFDSICGIEVEVLLSERLGFEVKSIPLLSVKDSHHLSVHEITQAVLSSNETRLGSFVGIRGNSSAGQVVEK